ncbi:MAG: hypothetical protein RKR03_02925, partial [Candidatus Competibacter sp.]|nr:hypothetical protein [Candidatus Competibacter sp.]
WRFFYFFHQLIHWLSGRTSDYVVSAYLPQRTVVDRNYLILLDFTSGITFIAGLPTPEGPTPLAVFRNSPIATRRGWRNKTSWPSKAHNSRQTAPLPGLLSQV